MAEKVTFDGLNRIIIADGVSPDANGQITLDAGADLYSAAKREWLTDAGLNKLDFPITAIGGNPLTGGAIVPQFFLLNYPWRIRPQEADHELIVDGNLFTDDGRAAFLPTLGAYTVGTRIQTNVGPFYSQVEQILVISQAALDLMEADEEFTATTAKKYHRVTKALILDKSVSGGTIANPPIIIDE